jgi:outer membrane lipoprotein-sorting protein
MSSSAGDGSRLARSLVLVLGIAAILGLGAALIGMRAFAAQAPPEELTNEELLTRAARAAEDPPEFSASFTVEQSVLPTQLLEASGQGEGPPALSGPLNARVWYSGPNQVRAELQGENGDRIFVRNGSKALVYNGAANTLRTGESASQPPNPQEGSVTPTEVDGLLDELAPTSELSQEEPVRFAGRQAYVLTLSPKDGGSTLVNRAQALIDSETYLPLRYTLYADGHADPVFSWRVSSFDAGPVPPDLFDFQTPPGAKVLPLAPEGNPPQPERPDEAEPVETETAKAETVAEAQSFVDFQIKELSDPPGDRELTGVYLKGEDGVVLTYGSGWGTVILAQGPQEKDDATPPGNGDTGGNLQQLPTVGLGGGVEAQELSTPVGSVLRWSADGASFVLAGSVPAPELEQAARGLR